MHADLITQRGELSGGTAGPSGSFTAFQGNSGRTASFCCSFVRLLAGRPRFLRESRSRRL